VRAPAFFDKTNPVCLLVRRPAGIFVAPFEQGEIGPDLFRAACGVGLEGAPRPALSGGPVEALDQGEEPEASSNDAGDGAQCIDVRFL
jgi:hypothetical protein